LGTGNKNAAHDSEHVIVGRVHADLGSLGSLNGGVGENKLEGSVIDSGEVAGARRLVLLRSQGERVHVDTLIRASGVRLVRLDPREVGSFTLRETILAVKLELSGDDGILSPAVHVQRGLSQNEGTSVRDGGVIEVTIGEILKLGENLWVKTTVFRIQRNSGTAKVGLIIRILGTMPVSSETSGDIIVKSTSVIEQTTSVNKGVSVSSDGSGTSESVDSVGEGVNGVSVVERLGAKNLEQESIAHKGRAIVNVLIGLNDPDKLLNGVVKVELDLVTGRTNRLVTSELELSDEVLVGVLGESSALVSVQEDIVNIQRGSNE
jgi:hypothetical protein